MVDGWVCLTKTISDVVLILINLLVQVYSPDGVLYAQGVPGCDSSLSSPATTPLQMGVLESPR